MAAIEFNKTDTAPDYKVYSWTGATNGGSPDTFNPVKIDGNPYSIAIQATGNFAGTAAIALHGSLDGTNYAALNGLDGEAISLTAAGLTSANNPVLYVKPVLSSGSGTTDIDVSILVRFD